MSSAIEDALSVWSQANLAGWKDSRQQELERLRKDEELALASRRNLVKITKDARSASGPEQLPVLKDLLKVYQSEIDSLSAKLKDSHALYHDAFASISHLPDPAPILAAQHAAIMSPSSTPRSTEKLGVDAINEAREQIDRLSAAHQEQEIRQRALEDQHRAAQEAVKRLQEERALLLARIGEAERSTAAIQRAKDHTESDNASLRVERDAAVAARDDLSGKVEAMQGEIARANEGLLHSQREAEERQRQSTAKASVASTNLELSRKEAATLRRELENAQAKADVAPALAERLAELEALAASLRKKIAEGDEERLRVVRERDEQVEALTRQLGPIESLRKAAAELATLKAASFGSFYTECDDQSLEGLLLRKSKRLEDELAKEHQSVCDLKRRLKALSDEQLTAKGPSALPSPGATQPSEAASPLEDGVRDSLAKELTALQQRATLLAESVAAHKGGEEQLRNTNGRLLERIRYLEDAINKSAPTPAARRSFDASSDTFDGQLGYLIQTYMPSQEARLLPLRISLCKMQKSLGKKLGEYGVPNSAIFRSIKEMGSGLLLRRIFVVYLVAMHIFAITRLF